MRRNSILFTIALVAAMVMAGSASAIEPVWGQLNTTVAEGQIVTLTVEGGPAGDYVTTDVDDKPVDEYAFDNIDPLLVRANIPPGGTYNATIVMLCSGTQRTEDGIMGADYVNTLRNTTPTTAYIINAVRNAATDFASLMELEDCPADLIVASITPNCGGYLFGNESNSISAKIENIGDDTASASNASFVLSDGHSATATVSQLAPGENVTVTVNDPTDRDAGDVVTITVTADCYSQVTEKNETNNVSTLDVTVVNNGYKGKTYTGGPNMTTWKSYDLNGNLVYSAGDSYYLSSSATSGYPHWTTYNASWTASDLPVSGTVVEARLYAIYTWDKKDVMSDHTSLKFNNVAQTVDEHYQDEKLHATSYPYGMLVYNVTDDFDTAGNYANLSNSYTGGGNVSMRGMLLVAIYKDAGKQRRLIYVNEEFDLLYGGSYKCTTPDEATAWAPISGSIDAPNASCARLITIAPGADGSGSAGEGELIFNGHTWNDEWTDNEVHQIGISDRDVTSYLQSTDNLVGFQSNADWMEASNAFLVVTLGNIISCDASGNPKSEFVQGEKVYAKGVGLPPGASYKLWIQDDPVYEGYALVTGNCTGCGADCPGKTGADVATDGDGCFAPEMLWNISATAPITYKGYDIIADNQAAGSVGTFDLANDASDCIDVAGFVAPVPELSSIVLLAVGLVMLVGLVRFRRKD